MMASKSSSTLLTLIAAALVVALLHGGRGVMAQSGCTSALLGLSPCLKYVTGNSSTPSASCCSQLANVVSTQPLCLCSLLNGGVSSSLGITINQTLALALPDACNVKTPPPSKCNSANGPASSAATPANSPAASPESPSDETPQAPSDSNTAADGGSKTTPSTTDGSSSSAGLGFRASFPLVALLLFIASYPLS